MKNLPFPIKLLLNFVFFILYWLSLCFIAGFFLGVMSLMLNFDLESMGDAIYDKISVAMLIPALVTIYFKDKFYISLQKEPVTENITKQN